MKRKKSNNKTIIMTEMEVRITTEVQEVVEEVAAASEEAEVVSAVEIDPKLKVEAVEVIDNKKGMKTNMLMMKMMDTITPNQLLKSNQEEVTRRKILHLMTTTILICFESIDISIQIYN